MALQVDFIVFRFCLFICLHTVFIITRVLPVAGRASNDDGAVVSSFSCVAIQQRVTLCIQRDVGDCFGLQQ
jgi:hypothetical protein